MTTANLPTQTHFEFMSGHAQARASYRLTATLFLLGGLLTGSGLIINSFLRIIQDELTRETAVAVPVGIVLILWTIMSACATFLTSAEITLGDQHLTARIVGPWQISLPLNADLSLDVVPHSVQLPYRKLADNERLFTVPLTGFHAAARLAAIYVGTGFKPALFITPDHDAYQTLVQHIQPDISFASDSEELS